MFEQTNLENCLSEYAEQIAENRTFLTRVWNLDNEERPGFMIGYVGPNVVGGKSSENVLFVREAEGTYKERLFDPEKYLQTQVKVCLDMLANKGDFVPVISPMIGIVAIPSALGCQIQWWENDLPATRPLISDPSEVYSLTKPSLSDGVMGMALQYTRHWLERTQGRFPIGPVDCQSPLDLAALVLGHSNYLMALYTHPKEIKYLLQFLTDLQVEFLLAQRQIVREYGAEYVPSYAVPWLPDGFGVNIAHDENVMISAQMHDEFALPYLNQISEAFNGIFIHSCGRFVHQLPSFAKVYKLRGLEFGASEATFKPVMDFFNGKIVLSVRIGLNQDIVFPSMIDFVRQILQARKTNRGLFINCDISNGVIPEGWPVVDLSEIYHLFGC
jgi:hypothetical protein